MNLKLISNKKKLFSTHVLQAVVIYVCVVIVLNSCTGLNDKVVSDLVISNLNIPKDRNTLYYPTDSAFRTSLNPTIDSNVKLLYSETLYDFKEPVFYNVNDTQFNYVRLLWLDAKKPSLVIRINQSKDTLSIIKKKLVYDENGFTRNLSDSLIKLSNRDWMHIRQKLNNVRINQDRVGSILSGKDGLLWILEWKIDGHFYFIERWDTGDRSSISPYSVVTNVMEFGHIFN